MLRICLAASQAERLPLVAVPEHYRLHFAPDLVTERFAGTATTRVHVLAPTSRLVHAAVLNTLVALAAVRGDAALYEQYRSRVDAARTPG